PTPPAGRCAPVLFDWSFTVGLCAAAPAGQSSREDCQHSCEDRWRDVLLSAHPPPLAAARAAAGCCGVFLLLERPRNVILAGQRQGQASLRSVRLKAHP